MHVDSPLSPSVASLRRHLRGSAFLPAEPPYGQARRGACGTTPVDDRHPAVVVLPETPEDVARALDFARARDLEISVRSGGHDALGASTTSHGVLIDLTRMSAVHVDAVTGIATAGAGARSGALGRHAAAHGRAAVLGMNPNVGLGGVTLGGGIGWLCGTQGATVDNLLAVDLVTADGRLVRADSQENPELFWGLRGGGGNFGVATAFTYRLPSVEHVVAGMVGYEVEPASFLRFVREFLADSPDALDIAAGLTVDPTPRGFIRVCWSGDPAEGERVLRPLTTFAPMLLDTVDRQTYARFAGTSPSPDNMLWRGGELDGLTDAVIDEIAGIAGSAVPAGCSVWLLHYMHGALCRVPFAQTPLIRQEGHILYNVVASWADSTDARAARQWVLTTAASLEAVESGRTYVNYLSRSDELSVRDTFGDHYARLQALKRATDPENVFRNNRNIVA